MRASFWRSVQGATIFFVFSAVIAHAHEFWLLPNSFQLEKGGALTVGLRNGENMKGISQPYLPGSVNRFEVLAAKATTPVTARLGDDPALVTTAPGDGLLIVVHETNDSSLTYKEFAKFESFVRHKAFANVLTLHADRGLPQTGFTESYRRYAKTLIAIGTGTGADRATGARIEIVAQLNPYTDDVSTGLPLRVLLDGAPRASAQIELFATAPNGTVSVSAHTTGTDGIVVVPTQPGVTYLADSVDMYPLPNNDPQAGPVWHTDWASLTYLVP